MRFARGSAERIVDKDATRRVHAGGNGERARKRHRRDAPGFDFSCDQSHGLMTHGSDGHHQSDIDFVLDETVRNRRREYIANLAR